MSQTQRDAGAAFLQHQEIAFSICMGMMAILGRGDPRLDSPALLWAFAGLLVFNLAYQITLRRRGHQSVVPMVSMAVNAGLITLVLACSGGTASLFWPMYLLPIFTACLYLRRRHVLVALGASAGFLACFYIEAVAAGPAWILVEFVMKAGVLALAAGVTGQLAVKERQANAALAAARERLEELSSTPRPGQRRREPVSKLINGLLYDMNHRLMVVQHAARLLSGAEAAPRETRADLERVELAMVSLRQLVSDVMSLSNPEDAPVNLARIFPKLPGLLDFKVQERQVLLSLLLDDGVPRLAVGRLHLEPALLDLMVAAIENAARGSTVRLEGRKAPAGACLTLSFSPLNGAKPVRAAADAIASQGAKVSVTERAGLVEVRVTLRDLSTSLMG